MREGSAEAGDKNPDSRHDLWLGHWRAKGGSEVSLGEIGCSWSKEKD